MTRERNGCDKNALFRKIQIYGFAMYDTVLFLDTHPCDRGALEYYNRVSAAMRDAVATYEEKYGPLTIKNVNTSDGSWKWLCAPWPWEYEAN